MSRKAAVVFWTAACFVIACPMIGAQPVLLQIRPHAGDTLAVRLDQRVEITGRPSSCARVAACADAVRHMTTVTEVYSRAIVRKVSSEGAMILAVTDSIRTSSSPDGKPLVPRLVGRKDAAVQMRLSTDGGAEVIDEHASDEMREVFGQMPATLSRSAVPVGGSWKREMRIPIAREAGAMGLVRATFHLDSLGNNGDIAYISMRGTLSHDHRDGSVSELDGWMTGSMQLDRRLGWITATRAVIEANSLVPKSSSGEPMKVRTRVTQMLKAGLAR